MQKFALPSLRSTKSATCVGYGSILLWSLSGILTAAVSNIPTFEVLAIAFGIGFLLSAAGWGLWGSFKNLKRPMIAWILGIVSICGSEAFYVSAFKFAPAAHVDLINSLWPIFVVIASAFIPNEKFIPRYLVASLVGFLGVYWMIATDQPWLSVTGGHWYGYALALLGACFASIYTLTNHRYTETSIETMTVYAGACMLFSLLMHFHLESTVLPSSMEWGTLIAMGILTQGLAYIFWNHGVHYGNYRLLSVLYYSSPMISILLLSLFGYATLTPQLLVACLILCVACYIAKVAVKTPALEAPNLESALGVSPPELGSF